MMLEPAECEELSMSCCIVKVPEGHSISPEHSHKNSEEFIFIINGNGHITVNDKDYILRKGSGILIEKGEIHALHNTGDKTMEAICIFVPPSSPDKYTYKT